MSGCTGHVGQPGPFRRLRLSFNCVSSSDMTKLTGGLWLLCQGFPCCKTCMCSIWFFWVFFCGWCFVYLFLNFCLLFLSVGHMLTTVNDTQIAKATGTGPYSMHPRQPGSQGTQWQSCHRVPPETLARKDDSMQLHGNAYHYANTNTMQSGSFF